MGGRSSGRVAAVVDLVVQNRPPCKLPPARRYYRAVHPCEHYLPFWVHNETDVVQLVQQLQGNAQNDLVAQHIAANSQAFALTFLSDEFAYWYWQRVVDKYAALYRGPRSSGGSDGAGGSSSSDGSSGSSDGSSAAGGDVTSSSGGGGPVDSNSEAAGGGPTSTGGGSRRLAGGSRTVRRSREQPLGAPSEAG